MSENPHSEWHSDDELASSLEDVMGRLGKVEAAAGASDTGRVELLEQAAAEAAVSAEPSVELVSPAAPVFEPAAAAPVAAYSNEDSAEVTAIIESYIDDDDDDESDPTDAFAAYYADAAPAAAAATASVYAAETVTSDVVIPQQDAPPASASASAFAPAGYVPGQTDEVVGDVVVSEPMVDEIVATNTAVEEVVAATMTASTATTSSTSTMFHVSDTRYEKPKRASFDEVFFGRTTAPASTSSEQ